MNLKTAKAIRIDMQTQPFGSPRLFKFRSVAIGLS